MEYLPLTPAFIRVFMNYDGTCNRVRAIRAYRAMQEAAGLPRPGLKLCKLVVDVAIHRLNTGSQANPNRYIPYHIDSFLRIDVPTSGVVATVDTEKAPHYL
mgnify:CR=1 FL=1|tara:strand:+ start:84 stop:386 length:303 start_codon:yes stop_codon:yes gene_type:complete